MNFLLSDKKRRLPTCVRFKNESVNDKQFYYSSIIERQHPPPASINTTKKKGLNKFSKAYLEFKMAS